MARKSGTAGGGRRLPAEAVGGQAPKGQPPAKTRIQAGRRRRVQVARAGKRKLFDEAGQQDFLEWFAATCNVSWSAEMAGFNYKTVLKHRMNDERFAQAWQRAVEQGYARLEAQRLETKRRETPIGIEGDRDAPEMDAMDPDHADRLLALHRKEAKHPDMVRRQGRRPRIATNAEVREALISRLDAFRDRVLAEDGADGAAPPGRCAQCPFAGGGEVEVERRGPGDEDPAGELDPGLRRGTDPGLRRGTGPNEEQDG